MSLLNEQIIYTTDFFKKLNLYLNVLIPLISECHRMKINRVFPKFCDKKIQLQLGWQAYRVTYTESRGGSRISRGTYSRGRCSSLLFRNFVFPKTA